MLVCCSVHGSLKRQTNYEQYLKDVLGFITDVKQRQNDAKLEIYQTDKNMVELKMKINEIRARLGLEGEEIDEKKMVEIDRLHRKKIELEQKLNELAESMSKQKQKVGYIQNVRNFFKDSRRRECQQISVTVLYKNVGKILSDIFSS